MAAVPSGVPAGAEREPLLLRLLERAAAASNEAASAEDALARVLGDACALLGFEVGSALLVAEDGSRDLAATPLWVAEDARRFEPLRAAALSLRLPPDDPRRRELFSGRRPVAARWDPSGAPRIRFDGREPEELAGRAADGLRIARACGIRSFAAVPIRVRGEGAGALVFASASADALDRDLLDALDGVALQLGRAIERERAARELQRREEHFRAILGSLVDTPVVVVSREGQIVESFGRLQNRPGLAEEMVLGVPASAWLPEEQFRRMVACVEEVLAGGEPRLLEQILDLPSGRAWFELRFYPLRGDGGTVERAICSVHDVTGHKLLEQALADSERLVRRIAEVSPVGLYRTDAQGRPIYVNDRAFGIAGVAPPDARQDWTELVDPRDRAEILEVARRAVERAEPFECELRLRRPDGSSAWVLYQGTPDRDEDGRPAGFVGTMTDVTESRRVAEELACHRDRLEELVAARTAELERSHEELRRSERLAAVGSFAAGIAHQISNPVGAMLLAAQTALSRPDDRELVATALADIANDALRCRRIVRGVLEFARGDLGELVPCDLNRIARTARQQLLRDARDRGAEVELDLADALPPVLGSEAALDQVVANLVCNALQARARRVRLRSAAGAGEVVLEIRDDGPGIRPEHLGRVLEPFFTTRGPEGGIGLGLSLAAGIVRAHGGEVELASEVGSGTVVSVRLPAAGEVQG